MNFRSKLQRIGANMQNVQSGIIKKILMQENLPTLTIMEELAQSYAIIKFCNDAHKRYMQTTVNPLTG